MMAATPKLPTESCPQCGGTNLAKVKGCVKCLDCPYKGDCNGWG